MGRENEVRGSKRKVDLMAVRKMVKLGLKHGIVAYELTAGDSQYHALSYSEIKELTRTPQ